MTPECSCSFTYRVEVSLITEPLAMCNILGRFRARREIHAVFAIVYIFHWSVSHLGIFGKRFLNYVHNLIKINDLPTNIFSKFPTVF